MLLVIWTRQFHTASAIYRNIIIWVNYFVAFQSFYTGNPVMTQCEEALYQYSQHTVVPSNSLLRAAKTQTQHFPSSFVHLICSYALYYDNFPYVCQSNVRYSVLAVTAPFCTGIEKSSLVVSVKNYMSLEKWRGKSRLLKSKIKMKSIRD